MGRTSKKKAVAAGMPAGPAPFRVYSVAIYARLSVDGDDRKNESIETQIAIAEDFMRQQNDMVFAACYTDIGRTGTNFKREGFARMMRDVRMRRIDCIIVKDLSRFGRNHIETGNYIEKIFPFLGVRFIAVTDHFDSLRLPEPNEALGVNLKNLVNEMYARDIALKVKAGRNVKREQGSYTGGVPPYGYRVKWEGDQRCLFPEEITSGIVKKIFELFLSGKNMKEIAVWLYGQRIARPSEYHKTGQIYCGQDCELLQWTRGSIKMILTNPAYMGCLVRGGIRGKDGMPADAGEWPAKRHTHEAIVSAEIFFQAAAKFAKSAECCDQNGRTVPAGEDIFADLLYCGDCGAKLKRITRIKTCGSGERVRTYSYNCPHHDRIDKKKCVTKSIPMSALTAIAGEAVRLEIALSGMRPENPVEAAARGIERMKKERAAGLADLERQIKNITRLESEQYLKYRMGEMSEEMFRRGKEANEKKTAFLRQKQADIARSLRAADGRMARKNHFSCTASVENDLPRTASAENDLPCIASRENDFSCTASRENDFSYTASVENIFPSISSGQNDSMELTAETARAFIRRIDVYQGHRVRLSFAFRRSGFPAGKGAF